MACQQALSLLLQSHFSGVFWKGTVTAPALSSSCSPGRALVGVPAGPRPPCQAPKRHLDDLQRSKTTLQPQMMNEIARALPLTRSQRCRPLPPLPPATLVNPAVLRLNPLGSQLLGLVPRLSPFLSPCSWACAVGCPHLSGGPGPARTRSSETPPSWGDGPVTGQFLSPNHLMMRDRSSPTDICAPPPIVQVGN